MKSKREIVKVKKIIKIHPHFLRSEGNIHRLRGVLAIFFLLGIFAACNSTSAVSNIPQITSIPTKELPQPETALESALQRFDNVQSFTIDRSFVSMKNDGDTWTVSSVIYYDQLNQVSLRESESTSSVDSYSQKLCMPVSCYEADATGLLKPSGSSYKAYNPKIESINLKMAEIPDLNYFYIGESTIDDIRVFEYQIQVTKEMIDTYREPPISSSYVNTLIEPYPVVVLYVNAENGSILRLNETYTEDISYPYLGDSMNYQMTYAIENDFADWDTTTFAIPEYVDAENTEWQEYEGGYSEALAFQFPKVYSLDEDFGYPILETPTGSRMTLETYGNIAMLSVVDGDQETGAALCYAVVENWFLLGFSEPSTIESAEWYDMENTDFCKAVISFDGEQEVEYFFNEPADVAFAAGRMLPATFWISIKPAEGDDLNTIFWDVIQTIHFGAAQE